MSESLHSQEVELQAVHGERVESVLQPAALHDELPAPTSKQRLKANVQFATMCWCMAVSGWNDGSAGPLLPTIQKVYGVGFTLVSLIFVCSCVGFISGAFLNISISTRLGLGKTMLIGSALQLVAYSLQAPALPFPAFVVSFALNGAGIALQNAQMNGHVAMLKNDPEAKMGLLHASYGIGAFCAPLIATQFARMKNWSSFYLVSLVLASLNSIALFTVFRFKSSEDCLAETGERSSQPVNRSVVNSQFGQILRNKATYTIALFLLVYVGIEVTIGGWIVTFIIEERDGGPDAGYISAGFFGGIALGRVLLLWLNRIVGERRVVYLYTAVAIALEFVVWFVPSLVGGGIAVSIVGLLLGPLYPLAMNHAGRILPAHILTESIGFVAAFGQAGSAALPFLTGTLAQQYGISSLQPLLVTMMGVMGGVWFLIPSRKKGPHTE